MLLLCDDTLILHLSTAIYPDMRKLAHNSNIQKKGNEQLTRKYTPITLLTICSKILEQIILTIFTTIVLHTTYYQQPIWISTW